MKTIIFLISAFLCASCSVGQESINKNELSTISLEDAGFNRDSIQNLISEISVTPQRNFRGLVVLKDNQIVIEEYFCGYGKGNILDIRSAGKSVTTLLLGIAIKEGLVDSLDQSLHSLFSKENKRINEDYKSITLRNVLDMSTGLDANSDDWNSYAHARKWIEKDNWKEFLLNIPKKSNPGKNFVYADIHPVLIGLAIEEASGMSLKDYAQKKLFEPLGITQFYWFTNASNQTGAAGNLYITTLDFAKFGALVANEGKWGDEQIVPSNYVESIINSKNTAIGDWFFLAQTYGMFWYKTTRKFAGKEREYLFASGNGGNQLIVLPKENIVIALGSGAYGQGYAHSRSYNFMKKILEALEE
ncbi:MAG: serine hydrolase domain-containing protein [Crocinitomicaceae bacterium]